MSTVALGAEYQRLWTATALSNLGDGIRAGAFPLLAASFTGRPALVAGVAVAAQLPWLLVGPASRNLAAGAVVDRVDRRRLLAAVDIGRAGLLAALVAAVATGHAGVWLLYAVAFVAGLGETLRGTAASTLLPPLVSADQLVAVGALGWRWGHWAPSRVGCSPTGSSAGGRRPARWPAGWY